ncbi:twin-arginine translocase TatA/TatE family subunit [Egicoccus sp. AB-alg2]|uniref:Sec-independent protein translocase subunit TatA/TatB n=1 Tax=Egicoccus sp. AB-alg2 TaxID=3242693 RepID=UPI00359D51A5
MPTLPGGFELVVILFVVLLLFGARKLPALAGSIGTSMREFRRAAQEEAANGKAGESAKDAD